MIYRGNGRKREHLCVASEGNSPTFAQICCLRDLTHLKFHLIKLSSFVRMCKPTRSLINRVFMVLEDAL